MSNGTPRIVIVAARSAKSAAGRDRMTGFASMYGDLDHHAGRENQRIGMAHDVTEERSQVEMQVRRVVRVDALRVGGIEAEQLHRLLDEQNEVLGAVVRLVADHAAIGEVDDM